MQLTHTVLDLSTRTMKVVVIKGQRSRTLKYTWNPAQGTPTELPANWADQVQGEVEEQEALEANPTLRF